jgi:hypothetical protein
MSGAGAPAVSCGQVPVAHGPQHPGASTVPPVTAAQNAAMRCSSAPRRRSESRSAIHASTNTVGRSGRVGMGGSPPGGGGPAPAQQVVSA